MVLALLVALSVALGAVLAGPPAPVRAQDDDGQALEFFAPVYGTLDNGNLSDEWTFDGDRDQVISVVVKTVSGDLDPVVSVFDPDGDLLAENDDIDSLLVKDAGLEALELPADGAYTVRVGRYGGEQGDYQLDVTPGFAQLVRRDSFGPGDVSWVTPEGELLPLAQERLRMRATPPEENTRLAIPPGDPQLFQDVYIQAEARLFGTPDYAEAGLLVRGKNAPGGFQAFQFKVNTDGEWSARLVDASGSYALQAWTADPALEDDTWRLAVLARGDRFQFYANGTLLGTVVDDRLSGPGQVGLLVMTRDTQDEPATVLFDDVTITTRLGTTYSGLPLALTTWDSLDFAAIAEEIAASEVVTLAQERDLYVPDPDQSPLEATTRRFTQELLGTEQALYGDFILGASVRITTAGDSVGCGLVLRWQDDRNLGLAYFDTGGGYGLVQAQDADLVTNTYVWDDDSSMVTPDDWNKMLVVAEGEQVTLYINGALVTRATLLPEAGRAGIALLNYEAATTSCGFADVWVWPLTDEAADATDDTGADADADSPDDGDIADNGDDTLTDDTD